MTSRRKIGQAAALALLFSSVLLVFSAACRREAGTREAGSQPESGGPGSRSASKAARRVVTLTPSLTEIVFALGAGDRIVGVSDYCDFPPAARGRPRVGSFLAPSVERILELHPDLVLLDGVQHEVAAVLRQAGVRALTVPMQDLQQVRQALSTVGESLGDRQAAAAALSGSLDRELGAIRAATAAAPRRRAVFVVDRQVGGLRGLVVAGPGSYIDELVKLAGGENVFADLPSRYAKVAVETLEERRPDVILDAVHVEAGQADLLRADWQVLSAVPAVAQGQVYLLGGREFVTPGPRLGLALRQLVGILHPELKLGP